MRRRQAKKQAKRSMSKYWYGVYQKALEWYDISTPTLKKPNKLSVEKIKKQWNALSKQLKAEGVDVETARETAKMQEAVEAEQLAYQDTPRSTNMQTAPPTNSIDFAREYIENYLEQARRIYRDTLQYIEQNKEGTHDSGKLASIAERRIDDISRAYYALVDYVEKMVEEWGIELASKIIAEDSSMDYAIAITLLPPSDVSLEFELTLQHLQATVQSANQIAEQRAQEMERNWE